MRSLLALTPLTTRARYKVNIIACLELPRVFVFQSVQSNCNESLQNLWFPLSVLSGLIIMLFSLKVLLMIEDKSLNERLNEKSDSCLKIK